MQLSDDTLAAHSAELRAMMILSLALLMGALGFMMVTLFLAQTTQPQQVATEETVNFIRMLSMANGMVAVGSWLASVVLYRQRLGLLAKGLAEDPNGAFPEFLGAYRAAHLLVLALFEGPALFGVVVCFLAHNNGVLAGNELVWLNSLTVLGLIAAVGILAPTQTRMRRLVNELHQRASLQ